MFKSEIVFVVTSLLEESLDPLLTLRSPIYEEADFSFKCFIQKICSKHLQRKLKIKTWDLPSRCLYSSVGEIGKSMVVQSINVMIEDAKEAQERGI